VSPSRAIARAAAVLAGSAIATSGALLACEPQDIYLFDAPPTQTRTDAGSSVPSPPPSESEAPSSSNPPAGENDAGSTPVQPACESAECEACVQQASCKLTGAQFFCHPVSGGCALGCDPAAPLQQAGNCPAAELCQPRLGLCVDCVSNGDCGGQLPTCDPERGSCVECIASGDCPAQQPLCDASTSRCIECSTDADCSATGEVCLAGAQRCVQCRNDADCGASDDDVRCLLSEQRCVECLSDADCTEDPQKPICSSELECDDDERDDN
jgi:hypothetical protein